MRDKLGLFGAGVVGGVIVWSSFYGSDSSFHAPRWVVGAAGALSLLAGLGIMGATLFSSSADRPIILLLFVPLFVSLFAAVAMGAFLYASPVFGLGAWILVWLSLYSWLAAGHALIKGSKQAD